MAKPCATLTVVTAILKLYVSVIGMQKQKIGTIFQVTDIL